MLKIKFLWFPKTSLQLPNRHTLKNHQFEFKDWPASLQTDEMKNSIKKWLTFFPPEKNFQKHKLPSKEQYDITSLLIRKLFHEDPKSFQREVVRLKNICWSLMVVFLFRGFIEKTNSLVVENWMRWQKWNSQKNLVQFLWICNVIEILVLHQFSNLGLEKRPFWKIRNCFMVNQCG